MSTDNTVKWEDLLKVLPKSTNCFFVDYNDSFDDKLELLQQCIREKSFDSLDEIFENWFADYTHEKQELRLNLTMNPMFNSYIESNDVEKFVNETMNRFEDEIEEYLSDHDTSNPIADLLRNTSNPVLFYDTGYEVKPDSYKWTDRELHFELKAVKKALKIQNKNRSFDEPLKLMLLQATYGGNLVIYFRMDLRKLFDQLESTHITFSGYEITPAVIDVSGGSGDLTSIKHSLTLPFNPMNLFIDKCFKHSFVYNVCGLVENFADRTEVKFTKGKKRNVKISSLISYSDQEEIFNKTFKQGSCTHGDIDINRHRNKKYLNNYPCGTVCLDCKTFWID